MTIEKTNKQTLLTVSEGDREDCKVTSVDVAMLFFLDVVIVFCAIKLFFNISFLGSIPQVKDIYEFLVSFEIVSNLLVRFQMTACYKKQKSIGFVKFYLYPLTLVVIVSVLAVVKLALG